MSEDLEVIAEKLLLEHREVRARSRNLEQAMNGGASSSDVARRLEAFLEHLRRHFTLEEQGDVFDGVPLHDERTRAIVASLLEEHVDLLERARWLLDRAREGGAEPVGAELREQIELLLADLRKHEVAENDVFQELVYREIGTKD